MNLAIQPGNCNGYANARCTCLYQYVYVFTQVENLLILNNLSQSLFPQWLLVPHCDFNDSSTNTSNNHASFETAMLAMAKRMDKTEHSENEPNNHFHQIKQLFARYDNASCPTGLIHQDSKQTAFPAVSGMP